jgi:beta-lactam-binding protein with PASTA domain
MVGRSCKVVANRSANICKAEDSAYMQSHLPHVVTMTVDQLHGVLEDMGMVWEVV